MAEKETNQTNETKKKKGKFKMLLVIIVCVLCLGIAGSYFLFGSAIIERFSNKGETKEQKKVEKKADVPSGPIMSLEPFLFNIANAPGKYAKISISIQFKDKKTIEEAQKIVPAMRDKVLTVLCSKGIDVLMDVGSRDLIRQEIHSSLKGFFHRETDISAIYITDIMIQ